MPQCLVIDQATGAVTATDATPCTTLIALTPSEFTQITSNPFVLSSEDGALIAFAIVAVWAGAYYWKAAAQALNSDGEKG